MNANSPVEEVCRWLEVSKQRHRTMQSVHLVHGDRLEAAVLEGTEVVLSYHL